MTREEIEAMLKQQRIANVRALSAGRIRARRAQARETLHEAVVEAICRAWPRSEDSSEALPTARETLDALARLGWKSEQRRIAIGDTDGYQVEVWRKKRGADAQVYKTEVMEDETIAAWFATLAALGVRSDAIERAAAMFRVEQ